MRKSPYMYASSRVRFARVRGRAVSGFAIQLEHEPERVSSFTCLRYKNWSFGIMAQVKSNTEKSIILYLYAKKLLMSDPSLFCHTWMILFKVMG